MSTRIVLSFGDVIAVTGVSNNLLRNWTLEGLIKPVKEGQGTGNHRVYSLQDAVAVAYAVKLNVLGFRPVVIRNALQVLTALPPGELERALGEGRTFLWPWDTQTGLVKPPTVNQKDEIAEQQREAYEALNVGALSAEVRRQMEGLTRRTARNSRGRKRGAESVAVEWD
jgi:DNA-binding transcriptional MerR regulator